MFRFAFDPLFGNYWVVAGIVFILAMILYRSRPTGDRLPLRGSRLLIVLRGAALLLLLFAMLRPALVYTKTERLSSTIHILVDRSESMSRPDELGGSTRFQTAVESLIEAQPRLKRIQRHTRIEGFTFDDALHPFSVREGTIEGLPEKPLGKETAIGAALDAVREKSAGKRILGTILFSDGNQQTRPPWNALPHDAAVRLRDAGIPLYAVRLGQSGVSSDVQDISVNEIQANDRVFVGNDFQVGGSIRIVGYRNEPIPVQLFFEDENGAMRKVAEKTVRSVEPSQTVPYRFSFAPKKTGYFKYTVQVPPQPKELVETNNRQSRFVRVIEGGLTVLFLQGERNFEQGPLQQSLNASADIQVRYLPLRVGKIGIDDGKRLSFQGRLERFTAERPSLAEEAFGPGTYDVYILGDIDSKAFKPEELQALTERIREGCGLIMLGGVHAFGAGGYAETPLADVSPVVLRAVDRQPFEAPIRRDIHWTDEIPMIPTDYGSRNYVTQLDSNRLKNEEIWKSLPPLAGANRFDKIKPGASIFAKGPQDRILLVSHLYGLGRVLGFAGDTTYRWRYAGFVEEHKRFWRQIVLWLAKKDGIMEGDCWITMENTRLLPEEPAKFQVFMRSSQGEELRHFEAEAVVSKPDGTTERVALHDDEGIPSGVFRATKSAGDYAIRVEISDPRTPDAPGRHATARFMVADRDLELDHPVAYPALLNTISTTTGGRSLAPEQLGTLLDELARKSDELLEKRETKRTLYDGWWFLIAFVTLLGAEWFLRKTWGLV